MSSRLNIAFILIIAALFIVLLKITWIVPSDTPNAAYSEFTIEYIMPSSIEKQTEIRLPIPISTNKNRITGQSLSYPGWRIKKRHTDITHQRSITFLAYQANPQNITMRFQFLHPFKPAQITSLTQEQIQSFTSVPVEDENSKELIKFKTTFNKLPNLFLEQEQFSLRLFQQTYPKLIEPILKRPPSHLQNCQEWILHHRNAKNALRIMNLPTREVCGVEVTDNNQTLKMRSWLQVNIDNQWQNLDFWPTKSSRLIAFVIEGSQGMNEIVEQKTGSAKYFFKNVTVSPSDVKMSERFYNLHLLPIDIQDKLKLLLVLPFAILIVAYIKAFWGIETFGQLTPALLGFSLAMNTLFISLVIMALIFIPAILIRKLVVNQNKTVEHTITITFIALSLAAIVVFADVYNMLDDPSDAILPVVILALLIDKYFTSLNKKGFGASNTKLMHTLMIAIIILLLLQIPMIGEILLQFPELHLITLAMAILLCRPMTAKEKETIQADPD